MISGGSCDTKNHWNKLHFKIILKSAVLNFKSNNISKYYCLYCFNKELVHPKIENSVINYFNYHFDASKSS